MGSLPATRGNWQWLSLDYRQRDHRRAQAAQSQVHHWTTRNWNSMGKKPMTASQQDWHIWHRTDLTLRSLVRSAVVQSGKQHVLTSLVLKRVGRYLLCTPRAVWEFPLQQEESIVLIDGLSDADAAGCPKKRRSTSGGCLRVGQHTLATWSSTQKVVSLSSATMCK